MAIAEVGTATNKRGVTPQAPTAPTGIAAGNLAYVAAVLRGGDGTTKANVNSAMTGWAKVFEDATGTSATLDVAISLWRRQWQAGDSPPSMGWQNDGGNNGTVLMIALSGHDSGTPEDVVAASLASGTLTASPTDTSEAGLTTLTDGALLLAILGVDNANVTGFTVASAPGTYTTDESSNVNRVAMDLASKPIASHGPTGTQVRRITGGTSGKYAALLWAVRPAAPSGLPPREMAVLRAVQRASSW